MMDINETQVELSKNALALAVDKLNRHLSIQNSPFIVGKQFSRADLSVAALLAPFITPVQYDLPWPKVFPIELQDLMDAYQAKLEHTKFCYQNFR